MHILLECNSIMPVGVSGSFGTAFGGVLFSIEFTASAYSVRTLPKAFLTSVVAMLVFLLLGVSDQLTLFSGNKISSRLLPSWREMLCFIAIGVSCGLLGVVFVYIVEGISSIRNRLLDVKLFPLYLIDRRRYIIGNYYFYYH